MLLSIMRNKLNSRLHVFMTKVAKIDTLFITKTAKTAKTAAHTFIAHIRNCPPILVFQTIDSG